MLIGADEYPLHQITQSFAGVAGSDPQWNDGHYVCLTDVDGTVSLTSNVRLYQNNDVLDGFVCLRHDGRQHNIRLSRRLRPDMDTLGVGPLRIELTEPMRRLRLVLDDNDHGISLDVMCHSTSVPYEDPVEITRVDGRLLSERATYELAGTCEGWVQVGSTRVELVPERSAFFRNHSWGNQAGRGGPRHGAPVPRRRVPGIRQWVLFHQPDHDGFFFEDPNGREASGKGAILTGDGVVPVVGVEHDLDFHDGGRRVRRGSYRLTDADGVVRDYDFESLGWVYCQGGGYFGGFDDKLGQGVYRGDHHIEGEVWDVSHPTTLVDERDGREFEFPYDWAETFTRVTSGGLTGMAHHECVVIPPRPERTAQ